MPDRPKILVVDDNHADIVALLTCLPADIVGVRSGTEAISATRDNDYALALVDQHIAGMAAYELVSNLRSAARTDDLPVVILSTAPPTDLDAFEGCEAGTIDFLTKPLAATILQNKVLFFLQRDRDRRELLAIRQSNDLLEDVLRSVADAIVVAKDGAVVLANSAAGVLLDDDGSVLLGRSVQELEIDALPVGGTGAEAILTRRNIQVPVRVERTTLGDGSNEVFVIKDIRDIVAAREERAALALQVQRAQRPKSTGHAAGGPARKLDSPGTPSVKEVVSPPPSTKAPSPSSGQHTILVVEDNKAVLRMVARVLQRGGFNVITAESYAQALAQANDNDDIQLLFTDVNLPGSNGVRVAQALRKIHPEIPVLFMSGNTAHTLRDRAIPVGRVGFIQKPFLPRALIQKIRETSGLP